MFGRFYLAPPNPPEGYHRYQFIREYIMARARAGCPIGDPEAEVWKAGEIYDAMQRHDGIPAPEGE